MAMSANSREIRCLQLSIVANVTMALLGFVFAWLTDSQAILMDGAFSFINCIVALATLQVARLVQQPEDSSFHFGYAHFEPMLNVFKGLLTLAICVFAAVASVQVMLDGGREIKPGLPIVYALIAAGGCFALAAVINRTSRYSNSEILRVEVKAWLIDGLLSLAVALAFAGMALLQNSAWAEFSPYADPLLMLVLVVAAAPIPFKIVKDNLLQLLWIAPSHTIQRSIDSVVDDWLHGSDTLQHSLHMVKIGRTLYVQVRLLLPASDAGKTLEVLDRQRGELHEVLQKLYPEVVADILFTTDSCYFGVNGESSP